MRVVIVKQTEDECVFNVKKSLKWEDGINGEMNVHGWRDHQSMHSCRLGFTLWLTMPLSIIFLFGLLMVIGKCTHEQFTQACLHSVITPA